MYFNVIEPMIISILLVLGDGVTVTKSYDGPALASYPKHVNCRKDGASCLNDGLIIVYNLQFHELVTTEWLFQDVEILITLITINSNDT